jgi:mono/diheme cytochrome c family protein
LQTIFSGLLPGKTFRLLLCGLVTGIIAGQAVKGASLAEGAFNEAQAIRGQALYYQHCLDCHGEAMAGVDKAPPLAGPQFTTTWNNSPLAALVARILTMPPEKPGTLSRAESVDVLTYILWYNGLPLGELELGSQMETLANHLFQVP